MLIWKLSFCLFGAAASPAARSASGKITGVVTDSAGLPMLADPDTSAVSANFGRIRTSHASYTPATSSWACAWTSR